MLEQDAPRLPRYVGHLAEGRWDAALARGERIVLP